MLYSRLPAFVLGFHGCDQKTAERVIRGQANEFPHYGGGVNLQSMRKMTPHSLRGPARRLLFTFALISCTGCAIEQGHRVSLRLVNAGSEIPLADVMIEKSSYDARSKTRTEKAVGATDADGLFTGMLGEHESFTFRKAGFAETSIDLNYGDLTLSEMRPDLLPHVTTNRAQKTRRKRRRKRDRSNFNATLRDIWPRPDGSAQ